MLIKSEQLSVGSLIKNVMLKYLFWASYILRLCAQTCTPNRHALQKISLSDRESDQGQKGDHCVCPKLWWSWADPRQKNWQ